MAITVHRSKSKTTGIPSGLLRLFTGICLVSVLSLTFWVSKDAARQIVLEELLDLGSENPLTSYFGVSSMKSVAATPVRRWAYAFLVGGVLDPLTDYRGFLYGVVVAAKILRDAGSRADVVLMVQLSYNTNSTRLPQDEEALLVSVGVKIKYLPKFAAKVHEQFYGLVMEKFRILEMTEYSRVLFLDSDIMPLCSLDYMFELSEPPVGQLESMSSPLLKENVVLSWKNEPGHAGFFMLSPGPGKFHEIQQIIRRREEEVLNMTFPYWDNEIGWGHRFNNETDFWRSHWGATGTLWDWWASFADQGLIYYWAKYHEKSTSIIIGHEVESWGTDENGVLRLERTITGGPLNNFTCIPPTTLDQYIPPSPYRDYMHFTGRSKPWDKEYTTLEELLLSEEAHGLSSSIQSRWFVTLRSATDAISFNVSRSVFGRENPVGRFSHPRLMYEHIAAMKERGWTAYQ